MSNNNEQNNISNEPELMNYLDTENIIPNNNISVEMSNNSFTQNKNIYQNNNIKKKEDILDIELTNIQMLILQRSLYILKKKFEINKKELELIYQKYKDEDDIKLKCINVDYLLELYKEIMELTQFTMLPYTNFNELISADLMTELNEDKTKVILKALVKFTKNNVEKYNRICFDKKMKKIKLIEENEKKKKVNLNSNLSPLDMEEYTTKQKIEKINKRGKIIKTFEEMIENNKEFEVGEDIIVKINEDDMSILNNKKLLYTDVIPLIIADFIQQFLKNNEHVAIVSTANVSEDQENHKLNQNVKSLFDKDIINFYNSLNKVDPNEENKEKLKNLLYELMNIENQIKIYQNLIVEKTSKGANVKHLMNMEKKLSEQKVILQKKINSFNQIQKNLKQSGADASVINNTNSNLGDNSLMKLTEKNKLFRKNNSNLKVNKDKDKGEKSIKYKIGIRANSSNNSLNSKGILIPNNNNSNLININIKENNSNSKLINNSYSNNLNTDNNNKFNYYYNNENFYYQHGIKYPETKEEFRKNSLLEIFYFYTKQHSFIGQTPSFQEILKSEEHLDMSEFAKFCVEFKILVKPQKIAEIFKKTALNSKELNYALFVKTLQKLSICANDEKKQYLMERIKIYKMKLKEIKEKNKGKDNSNNSKENENKENLSGIKSEGEAEDEEKCQQEKNFEKENKDINDEIKDINNENKDINNENAENNNNDKENNIKEKESDKKTDNYNNNSEKMSENNSEKINNNENNSEIQKEQNENEQNINKEKKQKKTEKNSNKENKNNNNNNISTNLKYYRQNKTKNSKGKNIPKKKLKLIKPKTNSFLMMETKEELEDKISKLKEDYDKLSQKTSTQLEEEFYQYLEIDDIDSYRKKMVGYIYPFIKRENISRFPLQSVARPFKKDPKMQKEMHKILVQRHEEMKKEKELKQIKEKNILFEKRKKKFEIDNRKLQQKMSLKNDYLQIKRNEEDYQKEKMNKLTWQQIQKLDYDTFIINEKDKRDKYKNNLEDIFRSNQFEGDDGDYLKNFRIKKGFNETENTKTDKKIGNKNNMNNNLNNNMIESVNKTEPLGPKFDTNISRISSGNNIGNNSEIDFKENSSDSNK